MKKLLSGIMLLGALTAFVSGRGMCQRPLPWHRTNCIAMEQTILDATVRIEFHGTIEIDDSYGVTQINGTISHATVINSRYLLTHNHFGIPLSQIKVFEQHAAKSFSGVSVYKLDGTAVLDHAALNSFTVVEERDESVLLDFGTIQEEGFFTQVGIASAKSGNFEDGLLQPNTEIGLIDWDGEENTRIVWAPIQTVYQDTGLAFIQIEHFIELGASGGGVFLQDKHIGNNWARVTETDLNTGDITQQFTLVALNS